MRNLMWYALIILGIVVQSACNNSVEEVSRPVKIQPEVTDKQAPKITRVSPEKNAANVDKFNSISAVFNERLDENYINELSVRLFYIQDGQDPKPVQLNKQAGIKYTNTTLVITPEQPMVESGLYLVRLLANPDDSLSIRDIAGNVLEANEQNEYFSWSFTISADKQNALVSISPLPGDVVSTATEPVEVTINPLLYGNADISEPEIQNSIIITMDTITSDFCAAIPVLDNRISGAITASPQNGETTGVKKLSFIPEPPGYPLTANINAYVCVKNKSGGVLLRKSWSFFMRDGSFQALAEKPLLNTTDGTLLADNTVMDAQGNVSVFWQKTVYDYSDPNDPGGTLISDNYSSKRFNATSGIWVDQVNNGLLTSNPAAQWLTNLRTFVDPQGRIMAIWLQGGDILAIRFE